MIWPTKIGAFEITDQYVKVAVAQAGLGRSRILKLASQEISVQDEEEWDAAATRAVRELVEDKKISADAYAVCLPSSHAIVRVLEVPFKGKRKVRSTVKFQLEPYVPFSIDDLVVDSIIIGQQQDATRLLAIGIRKDVLDQHLAILGEAGLFPDRAELEFVPLTNLLLHNGSGASKSGVLAVIHVTEQRSFAVVLEDRTLVFVRSMDFKGASILENAPEPTEEILTTLRSFMATSRCDHIDDVIITGVELSSDQLSGLEERIGVPIRCHDLRDQLRSFPSAVDDDRRMNYWEVVASAASGSSRSAKIKLNLRQQRLKDERLVSELKKNFILGGVLVTILVAALVGAFFAQLRFRRLEVQALEDSMDWLFEETIPGENLIPGKAKEMMERSMKEQQDVNSVLAPFSPEAVTALHVLNDVIVALPEPKRFEIKKMNILSANVVIGGQADQPDLVDGLEAALTKSQYLTDVKTERLEDAEGGRFAFDFVIRAKRQ